jgi:predicted nucleic acid-binding protein
MEWFDREEPELATCPITEGTLLRFLVREGQSALDAMAVLDSIRGQEWHEFWADSIPYDASMLSGVIGHRQVTDAYLVGLARHHQAQVVTFDKGLAALHGTAVRLLSA